MTKRHRVFIAINLPAEIKRELAKFQEKWPELPATWVSKDNLHITLLFLGYLTDTEMGELSIATKEVAERHGSFEINLEKVVYGPVGKLPPKMIWISGGKNRELSALKNDLQKIVSTRINFRSGNRGFSPHITLARIKTFAWKQIEPEERPEINEVLNLSLHVESIEIMESQLKKTGPVYSIIESFELI